MRTVEIETPIKKATILGLVTAKEIDFDCSELVEKEWDGTHYWYKNYLNESEMFKGNPNKSAYSLLQSKGISFVNPLGGEPNRYDDGGFNDYVTATNPKWTQWQQSESQIWKKAVILLVE